ncbi:methyltransferase [Duganella sp. FT134W]|uniref:Methyltransferase n=1 Tax=Duganella margarita TaxID=2692170 RepID=A0A7X4KG34_9BURK|nr:methyltransferase [Duganella margarita]MYM71692.1 methyltransferase [Duganella margarita]
MKPGSLPSPAQVDHWQRGRQLAFKAVPAGGRAVEYLGKRFHVYPETFWPFADSQPLVRSLRVDDGDSVLDVGTGSGVIAIHACYLGAARVLALDVNPAALRSARRNAAEHGFSAVMEVRDSDLFEQVGDEQFDVITANLPFRDKAAPDVVARSQWDTGFRTNTRFFQQVTRYLKPGGRIYFAHANFGAPDAVLRLAAEAGLRCELLATGVRTPQAADQFYALLLQRAPAK